MGGQAFGTPCAHMEVLHVRLSHGTAVDMCHEEVVLPPPINREAREDPTHVRSYPAKEHRPELRT
jgi:hypothetical protein